MAESLVSGWTEDIDYTLRITPKDGVEADLNLSGMTVALVVRKPDGTEIAMSGDLTVTDAENGAVRFEPAAGDISRAKAAEYHVRWQVTDGSDKVSYFPHEAAEKWTILI